MTRHWALFLALAFSLSLSALACTGRRGGGDDDDDDDTVNIGGDGDGVPDEMDNCPDDRNSNQADADHDGIGDACDDAQPPPDGCDGTGVCDDCVSCAGRDTCSAELNACQGSPDCQDFAACGQACAEGDEACFTDCQTNYPDGANIYMAFASCIVCDACYEDCDGATAGCQ